MVTASYPESGYTYYEQQSPSYVPGYDANGNLKYRQDASGVVTQFTYDALNRIKTKSYLRGGVSDPRTTPVTYNYDPPNGIGRLVSVVNGISSTSYAYDSMGRLQSNTQTTNSVNYPFSSYLYNAAGLLKNETYPSGRVVQTSYDALGRPNQVNDGTGS